MDENNAQPTNESVAEPTDTQPIAEEPNTKPVEPVAEEKQPPQPEEPQETERERNLKAENRRKQQENAELKEELKRVQIAAQMATQQNIDLTVWNNNELRTILNCPQYSHLHAQASDLLDRRKIHKAQSEAFLKGRNIGRRMEKERQTDIRTNFNGDSSRPAPVRSERVDWSDIKRRAMAGDKAAYQKWMQFRFGGGA